MSEYTPFDDGQASGRYLITKRCPQHGRWTVWTGCRCAQHSRPCPECPKPAREYIFGECLLKKETR